MPAEASVFRCTHGAPRAQQGIAPFLLKWRKPTAADSRRSRQAGSLEGSASRQRLHAAAGNAFLSFDYPRVLRRVALCATSCRLYAVPERQIIEGMVEEMPSRASKSV